MAARPKIRAGDPADCDALFPVVDFFPQYVTLQIFGAEGTLCGSSEPQANDAPFAQEALKWMRSYLPSHPHLPRDPVLLPIRGHWISVTFRPVPMERRLIARDQGPIRPPSE